MILLKISLDESGYSAMLKNKKDLENENRLENLKELLRAMQDYENFFFRTCCFSNINRSRVGGRKSKFDDYACSKRIGV